jgi:hypothetical protein
MNVSTALIEKLKECGCQFEILTHNEVYVMDDVERELNIPYQHRVKSLFVKDKQNNSFYVFGIGCNSRLDFKKVADLLHVSRSSLVFASPKEYETELGVPIGTMGLISLKRFRSFLSRKFLNIDPLFFGIGETTKTVCISQKELSKFQDILIEDIESI